MTTPTAEIDAAARAVRTRWQARPRAAIILGTGLGGLVDQMECDAAIPYREIPHFSQSTALGQKGRLVCGRLAGTPLAVLDGRFHAYEGYSLREITLPVRVLRKLGAGVLIVTCAAGGMNPYYKTGDVMVIDDHIDLMGRRWSSGAAAANGPDQALPRQSPYNRELVDRARQIARRENLPVHRGVYVAVLGPNYETRAEYRCFRRLGGDVVGMSTVPEVVTAAALGMRVLALSTVTNVCLPDALEPARGEDVVAVAEQAAEKLGKIVLGVLADESRRR
ncbi:MAG: purine-nucleoside phosphorylase [Planctomycetia bacterium]|nr:MAG: purine-nucleoside phosphorylase [Planctomycetia bacterium]